MKHDLHHANCAFAVPMGTDDDAGGTTFHYSLSDTVDKLLKDPACRQQLLASCAVLLQQQTGKTVTVHQTLPAIRNTT